MLPLLLGKAPICGEAVAPCDMLKPMVMFDIAPFRPKIAQKSFKSKKMAMRKKTQTVYLVCVSNSHFIQFSNSSFFIKPAIETIP